MKEPGIEIASTRDVNILSVSPIEEDHVSLERTISRTPGWRVQRSHTLDAALTTLARTEIPVVVCERNLSPGSWADMVEPITALLHSPYLIVTSRLADDHLWAEVLNAGAWDVLAKPFADMEVLRVVTSAWLHWADKYQPTRAMKAVRAASRAGAA